MDTQANSNLVKASDYVAEFIAGQGIKEVFAITGGASIHMIHSIAHRHDLDFVCPHHEQAAAMAADAYSRITGNLGCALATSGPGATNLITGIAGAWFDSVPVLYITGQVTRFRFRGDTGVRQMGFQETDIVPMVKPVTKYAVQVTEAENLRYELEKAVHIARSGRPGPVLVDLPDDLQREMINPASLRAFEPDNEESGLAVPTETELEQCITLLTHAKRPVLILGSGIRLAGAADKVAALITSLGVPVCPSWGAADMVPADNALLGGTFGTHGTRAGNFTVQNADLVLVIGARLSTRETGSPLASWAREARTVVVDIDAAELGKFAKFGKPIDLAIHADAGALIDGLLARIDPTKLPDIKSWRDQVAAWRVAYPVYDPTRSMPRGPVDPYAFVEALSRHLVPGDVIVTDTGCAVAWMLQGFKFKTGQRLFHAFNNTPMGYGLPGAIGAAFALGGAKRVICVVGDGSLMMNLQEMATARHHNLPIKMFLMNNDGYAMVQQTEEQWLEGNNFATATGSEGGLSFPDFNALARSFDWGVAEIDVNAEIEEAIAATLASPQPVLCNTRIPSTSRVTPQSRFGYPIEDAEPLLPRDEFRRNMLVEPMPVSMKAI